jgi:hypothetical protein
MKRRKEMGYSQFKNVQFSPGFANFVEPYLGDIPSKVGDPPLSLTVRVEGASRCAYHWRNYFNSIGIKPYFVISIVPLDAETSVVQIDFVGEREKIYVLSSSRRAEKRLPSLTTPEAQKFLEMEKISKQQADESDPFFKEISKDILKIAEAFESEEPSAEAPECEYKGENKKIGSASITDILNRPSSHYKEKEKEKE